ncbi:hypothetical protein GGX14DRAFT_377136 [Mycena pura]|uniref:Oxidoreductase n=1 Tax=Mycena pura TaxID=153505 RepID=A0AAD6UUX0_9AGAR|nr:hypothetical protein GGX14DRAFT_377136 [Mycena pura]
MSSLHRIRVGLIGLSSTAVTSWAANAHLPYLLSPRGLERFQIVALCNSSVDAARAAIKHHGLDPAVVRAHGDPESLAADKDVDLVVCNTRVDRHFETIEPSVRVGKNVFCEWPLAENGVRARQLVDTAKKAGGKTVIDLQGRLAPLGAQIASLLGAEGPIGRVLSVEARSGSVVTQRDVVWKAFDYFMKREVGGNILTITFGHLFDFVQTVVGDVHSLQSHLHLQHPLVRVRDPATDKILETVQSNVPDLIISTGTIRESTFTQKGGASFLIRVRRGGIPGEPGLVWTICGEKGEIRVTSPSPSALQVGPVGEEEIRIDVHNFATNEVRKVEWNWQDWQNELPMPARNVAAVYEAFAQGQGYPTFEDALVRHEQLDEMLAGWKAPGV